MKEIARGAEAVIYLDKNVVKERIKKGYRIKEIDDVLRKSRTRREAKVYDKLKGFPFIPRLISSDDRSMKLEIEYIDGKRLADHLEKLDWRWIGRTIGKQIAQIHNLHIIHGDLTTSNMILKKEVYFIDFGLSFFSHKVEDMAVDLHLIKEALESKHYTISEGAFKHVLAGYRAEAEKASEVIERMHKVEERGRYKQKH